MSIGQDGDRRRQCLREDLENRFGEVTLNADGKLTVNIRGLVLNDPSVGKYDGSPDSVDAVAVAVVCRGKRGLVAAQTEPVALS
jgi:hypothetical protein